MFFQLLVLLVVMAHVFADDGIVLEPLAAKNGPAKILIYVHGAEINEKNYVTMSEAIQKASNLSLWVGLPHFAANTPNPVTITSAITKMVSRIGVAGNFSNPPSPNDVLVAAHSLGGVFAPAVVNKQGYAALLEFGSYVTNGLDITTTRFPVLTLGGELDGLTRATRIALEYAKMKKLPQSAYYTKPVVILPGICHSQFLEGVNVTSTKKDLRPDVSWQAAHQAIASVAADFMALVVGATAAETSAARARFDNHFQFTEELVSGFLTARKVEASSTAGVRDWCSTGQALVAGAANKGRYTEHVDVVKSSAALAVAAPSLKQTLVKVVSYAQMNLNPIDVSTIPVAAKSLTCEMISSDAIDQANKDPDAGGKPVTPNLCRALNEAALTYAQSLASAATVKRFASDGQILMTVPDLVRSTGPTFLASELGFDSKSSAATVSVRGVSLATETTALLFPGVYECIVLSPAKAVEWMMVDGLPKIGT